MKLPRSLHLPWVAALTFALAAEATWAETYVVDRSHSSVDFSIRHLVGRTKGRFGEFSGTISYDAAKPQASSFSGIIQVKSIDTGNERRDGHLRSADFFEAEAFPEITFESTEVTGMGESTLGVKGKLTMHGTTREVTLSVEILGTGTNPRSGKAQIGLETNFAVLCSDYGVNSWERFSAVLGDEVRIQVLIEANAESEAQPMRVESVELTLLDLPFTKHTGRHMQYWLPHWRIVQICRLTMSNGVVGFGETIPNYTWAKVPEGIEERVVGREADELMWEDDLGAGVQIALFDAVGRHEGVPVHQLLGTRVRDYVPLSWWAMDMPPRDWARQCRAAVKAGLHVGQAQGPHLVRHACRDPGHPRGGAAPVPAGPRLQLDPRQHLQRRGTSQVARAVRAGRHDREPHPAERRGRQQADPPAPRPGRGHALRPAAGRDRPGRGRDRRLRRLRRRQPGPLAVGDRPTRPTSPSGCSSWARASPPPGPPTSAPSARRPSGRRSPA